MTTRQAETPAFSDLVDGSVQWWTHLTWLGYLCFPVLEVLRQPRPFWYYVSVLVALGLFLAAYLLVLQRPGPMGNAAATALSVVIAVLWHRIFGSSAIVFLLYAAVFAGFQASLPHATLLAVGLEAFLIAQWRYGHTPPPPLIALGVAVAGITVGSGYIYRWLLANRQLRLARRQVERLAQAAERDRIARDLHDLLGHSLSLVVLKAELAKRLSRAQPDKLEPELGDIEKAAREALAQVRAAVRGYRSDGLMQEAERMRQTLADAGIECRLSAEPALLSPSGQSLLSLVLREAVTNILRHSRVRSCRIDIAPTTELVRLSVADDGLGRRGAAEGSGLTGMRERLEMAGGRLIIEDGPGSTIIVAELPLLGAVRDKTAEGALS